MYTYLSPSWYIYGIVMSLTYCRQDTVRLSVLSGMKVKYVFICGMYGSLSVVLISFPQDIYMWYNYVPFLLQTRYHGTVCAEC